MSAFAKRFAGIDTSAITAAIYEGVSTKTSRVENQLVRQYARSQGWEIREFAEEETGKHASRAAYRQLFKAASRRKVKIVLVWSLDHFAREGVEEAFLRIKKLLDHGIQFESLSEPHFRTIGPAGKLMIAIVDLFAKERRERVSTYTKTGLVQARADGRILGRPWKVFPRDRAAQMRKDGLSWRAIAGELGVGQSIIRSALQRANQTSITAVEARTLARRARRPIATEAAAKICKSSWPPAIPQAPSSGRLMSLYCAFACALRPAAPPPAPAGFGVHRCGDRIGIPNLVARFLHVS
jgi:DNA invertase Pin-like site-specific DNA recombinase